MKCPIETTVSTDCMCYKQAEHNGREVIYYYVDGVWIKSNRTLDEINEENNNTERKIKLECAKYQRAMRKQKEKKGHISKLVYSEVNRSKG